jgi:hypothetical protein
MVVTVVNVFLPVTVAISTNGNPTKIKKTLRMLWLLQLLHRKYEQPAHKVFVSAGIFNKKNVNSWLKENESLRGI